MRKEIQEIIKKEEALRKVEERIGSLEQMIAEKKEKAKSMVVERGSDEDN